MFNAYDELADQEAFEQLVRRVRKDKPSLNVGSGRGGVIRQSDIEDKVRESEEVTVISDLIDSLRKDK